MKKQLLFTTGVLVTGMLSAQVAKQKITKIPAHLANIAQLRTKTAQDNNPGTLSPELKAKVANSKRVSAMTQAVIGTTYYDLQSNSAVGDRIFVNQDGSISAVWTMEPVAGNTTYPNRGTGYNYFNGTTWGPAPTARVENVRVGWGNIVHTRTGKEVIIAHGANAAGKMNAATRPVKGTGTWANSITSVPTATTGGNFWPRMVAASAGGSDTIYSIALTYPVAQGGVTYFGLDGAVVFSRSRDGGATWDIANTIPTGLDTSRFKGFGGDGYAIAAKGATVAVLAGDVGKDLTLSKSTNGGVTWTKTTVLKFPIKKWDYTTTTTDINNDGIADTLNTNDGTFALTLDNNGVAYAFYGDYRILNDAPSASGYSYFPYTDGLLMWNESMPADLGGIYVAAIEDLGGDNVINFPTPSTAGDLAFGRYFCSLTSFPSAAFDAQNNLYLSYSSVVDGLASLSNSEKLLRHEYVIKSCDGGQNWSNPMDVVGQPGGVDYEGMFGSMAKNVDGNVHLIFQRDLFAGYGVPPTSGTSPDAENIDGENEIVYVKIPTVDMTCPIITSIKDASSLAELSFYPNPASANGTIAVTLKENAKMSVVVMNSVGQALYTTNVDGNAGVNKVNVNLSNLSSGIYFYQVKIANNKAITNKFVVEK